MNLLEENPIRLGISACLLGEPVRYDGGHKLDKFLRYMLGRFVTWVPVCPEVECGLPVPREAMHLVDDGGRIRLVTIRSDVDMTDRMTDWAQSRLDVLADQDLCGFVFKSKSPSSGMTNVRVYRRTVGAPSKNGVGIFARMFMERFPFLPVEDEGRLNDPDLRENFIERVFVSRRWKNLPAYDREVDGLMAFHADHKLLIMAHSPQHLRMLGRLVASATRENLPQVRASYFSMLMEALKRIATPARNANALNHAAGFVRKHIDAGDRAELSALIEQYRLGLIPLVVPIALIKHHVRRYDEPYLKRQVFLDPHPMELMLRNHA